MKEMKRIMIIIAGCVFIGTVTFLSGLAMHFDKHSINWVILSLCASVITFSVLILSDLLRKEND